MTPHDFIVIEGNIGAGKTTLATKLSQEWNTHLILEEFSDNPFLPSFYENPEKYAFTLEMSFLAERFNQLKNMINQNDLFNRKIISDYFIDKCTIFAKNNLAEDEYTLFLKLFKIIRPNIRRPDLILYLHNPVEKLLENIRKRGRPYEAKITPEYLKSIEEKYFDFFYKNLDLSILIADMQHFDFVQNEQHYRSVKNLLGQKFPKGITHITL
ncbi:MAG: deoxynucleoside kinase [Bacteroidetes bacterium]|nr:MAG: deoxynucleoside kinase [Bacteroidota bacterium]